MAVFDHDALLTHPLDYHLAAGCVTLFWSQTALEEAIAWLRDHGYEVASLNAFEWMTEDDLHCDFASTLDFPDYYGGNLAALNDCLGDVAVCDYGVSPEATGLVLVLIGYDKFTVRRPEVAQATLDIIAGNAQSAMLFGHRMFCLVQSDDPDIVFEPVGAIGIGWNRAEWLVKNRRPRPE